MSNTVPFNVALFSLLNSNQYPAAMSFNERGDTIVIHSFREMENTVLPEVFGHSNYSSFVRQMNVYGFHKKRGGPSIEFVHPYFKQGRGDLVLYVQRQKRSCQDDIAAQQSSLMPPQTGVLSASALGHSSGSQGPIFYPSNSQLSTEPNTEESNEIAQLRARLTRTEQTISQYADYVKSLYAQLQETTQLVVVLTKTNLALSNALANRDEATRPEFHQTTGITRPSNGQGNQAPSIVNSELMPNVHESYSDTRGLDASFYQTLASFPGL